MILEKPRVSGIQPPERGFTLIEVMLATTLFAMLMASYYVVFTRVLELEEVAREDRSFASIAPSILDVVEDDLQSFYTHPKKPDAFPFRGEDDSLGSEPADRMSFVTRRASIHQEKFGEKEEFLRSPINEVGYRLQRNARAGGDVRRLFRREGFYVDQSPLEGGDFYEIYDRVIAFDVTYAGYRVEETERSDTSTLGKHELEKFESWDSEERKGLPSAVIVSITIEAPQTGGVDEKGGAIAPRRQTMVRIIPIPQAADIPPSQAPADAAGNPQSPPAGTTTPPAGTNPPR